MNELYIMTISLVATESNPKGIKVEIVGNTRMVHGTTLLKRGFAHMCKHGVVMDVTNVEQAVIAEEAGAVAVMVLTNCHMTSGRQAVLQGPQASR